MERRVGSSNLIMWLHLLFGCMHPKCSQKKVYFEGLEWKLHEGSESHLLYSLLCPLYLKQGLVQGRCSVYISWKNGRGVLSNNVTDNILT